MIRLNLSRDLFWLELLPGLRLQLRPISSAFVTVARELAAEQVPGPIKDSRLLTAQRSSAFLVAMAQLAVVAWEGVGDAEGNAIAVSDAGIAALLDLPAVAAAFSARYFAPAVLLDEEKNDSTAGVSGTSAAATATAATVPPPASPAPRADAA